jgi:hypothetical protein
VWPGEAGSTASWAFDPRSSVKQKRLSGFDPRGLVRPGHRFQVGRRGCRVVHPFAQRWPAVDEVDRQAIVLVFVGKVAPQRVAGRLQASALNARACMRQGLKAWWS